MTLIAAVEKRRWRSPTIVAALFLLATACAHPQGARDAFVSSSLPRQASGASAALIPEPERYAGQLSTSDIFIDGAGPAPGSSRRRLGDRIMGRIASEIQKMRRHSLDDPFSRYRVSFLRYQDNYLTVEDSAGTLGIDKTTFRQGLVIATAATAAGLGALNRIKPEGLTDRLFHTSFRIGYDVSQLDDPKLFFTYHDLFRVGGDRDGLYGSFRDKSGRLYAAEVNIFKMRAVMTLTF